VVTVVTGSKASAGTGSNVSLSMFGSKGASGKLLLTQSATNKAAFGAGQTDAFYIIVPDFGELKTINVSHDGKEVGSGWYLEQIFIKNNKTGDIKR
jgi:hypothetical protein